jgi:transposase-like protein
MQRWLYFSYPELRLFLQSSSVEQDHRSIKKITKLMIVFKVFHTAKVALDGIETTHMIRKGQISEENISS